MSNCMPHVAVVGSFVDTSKRREFGSGGPTVLCGKCWRRLHPFLEVTLSHDAAAIRRHRKRRMARRLAKKGGE